MNRWRRGFGLVEMLAALAVFGVASAVLLVAFGQAARTLEQVRINDRLSLSLRTLFDEQRDRPLAVGVTQGMNGAIAWRSHVTREAAPAQTLPMFRLQISVSQGGRELSGATLVVQSARSDEP